MYIFYDLNIFHEIVYIRPFLTLPFVLIAALYHARNEQFIKAVSWIIILTGLSQALIGIIHAYVLPEIVLGAPAAVVGKFFYIDSINGAFLRSRETGTIGSATYYANFILMAMFVLVWKKPSFKILPNILNILFRAIFSFILLFGIILSLNRLTIILTVICAFFSFGELSFSNFKKKSC